LELSNPKFKILWEENSKAIEKPNIMKMAGFMNFYLKLPKQKMKKWRDNKE
jgi:hypothetical protein